MADLAAHAAQLPGMSEAPHDTEGFRGPQVSALVGITYRQLDYWARTGLLRPSIAEHRRRDGAALRVHRCRGVGGHRAAATPASRCNGPRGPWSLPRRAWW